MTHLLVFRVYYGKLAELTSWTSVPAFESVPVAGAFQKAPQRWMVPKLQMYVG